MNTRSTDNDHIVRAYIAYSRLIGYLAIFLVIALVGPELSGPRESLSAYYHGDEWQRNLFVGALCAVAAFLVLYKGIRDLEAHLLSLAGVAAIFVAFFPTPNQEALEAADSPSLSIHGVAAGVLFVCIFVVGVVLPWVRKKRGLTATMPPMVGYGVSAAVMLLGAVLAWAGIDQRPDSFLFLAGESCLVIGFGIFWLVRTHQLKRPETQAMLL